MAAPDSTHRFQCNICGLKLVSKSSLNRHEDIHKENLGIISKSRRRKRSIECDICGKSLVGTQSLNYHKRNVHVDNDAKHRCDLCEKTFKEKQSLISHKRKTHNNLRATCNQCGIEVKSIYLEKHERIHQSSTFSNVQFVGNLLLQVED